MNILTKFVYSLPLIFTLVACQPQHKNHQPAETPPIAVPPSEPKAPVEPEKPVAPKALPAAEETDAMTLLEKGLGPELRKTNDSLAHLNPPLLSSHPSARDIQFHKVVTENPAQLFSVDENGRGLLHHIAHLNDEDLISRLIHLGGDELLREMTWPDKYGRLPLHYAHTRALAETLWHSSIAERALNYVDVHLGGARALDHDNSTPVALMASRGDGEALTFAVEQLCRRSSHWFTNMTVQYLRGAADFAFGNELNWADRRDRTPLMRAAYTNSPQGLQAVHALVSCPSVDIGAVDQMKRTALHYAATRLGFASGHAILVRGTLGVGNGLPVEEIEHIDLEQEDINGNTALDVAYRCQNFEAIHILKRFGAKEHNLNVRHAERELDPLVCQSPPPAQESPAHDKQP